MQADTLLDIEPMRVENDDFLAASIIERGHAKIMLRELFQNCKDSAGELERGHIYIGLRMINSVPKFYIWNDGPGMSATSLRKHMHMSSSSRAYGVNGNFGCGAKANGCAANPRGFRMRSCTGDGLISQVTLARSGNSFGQVRTIINGKKTTVTDVTEEADEEGLDPYGSWTDVTLFGLSDDHNTAEQPYPKAAKRTWVIQELYQRFFRNPEHISVEIDGYYTRQKNYTATFKTLSQRMAEGAYTRYETVTLADGIKLHYVYDADVGDGLLQSTIGALQIVPSFSGVIFRDEIYDVPDSKEWSLRAPLVGIPFGYRNFHVLVELPDDCAVRPDLYRRILETQADSREVKVEDFATLIRDAMPVWVKEVIASLRPDVDVNNEHITAELQKLVDELKINSEHTKPTKEGAFTAMAPVVEVETDDERDEDEPRTPRPHRKRRRPQKSAVATQRAPTILWTNDKDDKVTGRAAVYLDDINTIYMNRDYPAFTRLEEHLIKEVRPAENSLILEMIRSKCDTAMAVRVGRAVVYACSKIEEWDYSSAARAWAPESLSVTADDFSEAAVSIKRDINRRFRPKAASIASGLRKAMNL